MVIHEESDLVAILSFFITILGAVNILLVPMGLFAFRKFRTAAKVAAIGIGWVALYLLALVTVSVLSPQTIVKVGDSYCADIWCIGIDKVNATPRGQGIVYRLDVHIFSDANTVTTSAKGVSFFLIDEGGHRFPLIRDPSVVPVDVTLNPRQSVNTSLTFVTTSGVRQLFLTAEDPNTDRFWWTKLYFGSDFSLLHKPPLLRVL